MSPFPRTVLQDRLHRQSRATHRKNTREPFSKKVIDVHVEIGEAACVRDGRTRGDAEIAVPSFATVTSGSARRCWYTGRVTGSPGRAASHSNERRDALVNALFPNERPRMWDETRDALKVETRKF